MTSILRSLTVLPKSKMGEKPTSIRTMSIKNKSSVCFEELEDSLDNWNMPKINFSNIYYKSYFLSRNKYFIKTIEKTFGTSSNQETVHLLKREDLDQLLSGYKYWHIGFVQISIKPLT